MKKLLCSVLLLLCLCTGTAFAADWQYLGKSEVDGSSNFIDKASIQNDDSRAVVWQKFLGSDGGAALQQIVLTRADRKWALKSRYIVEPNGRTKSEVEPKKESELLFWEIVPDSDKEALYTSVWPNELNISPDRWYYLGTYKDNGNTLFVDNATVRKDSQTAILWTKENTSSETEPWAKVLQIVRRKERTITTLVIYHFIRWEKGSYIDRDPVRPPTEYPILPDSLDEKLYDSIW